MAQTEGTDDPGGRPPRNVIAWIARCTHASTAEPRSGLRRTSTPAGNTPALRTYWRVNCDLALVRQPVRWLADPAARGLSGIVPDLSPCESVRGRKCELTRASQPRWGGRSRRSHRAYFSGRPEHALLPRGRVARPMLDRQAGGDARSAPMYSARGRGLRRGTVGRRSMVEPDVPVLANGGWLVVTIEHLRRRRPRCTESLVFTTGTPRSLDLARYVAAGASGIVPRTSSLTEVARGAPPGR
jgi:hypothetical protein